MSRAKTLLMLPLTPGLFFAAAASAQIRSATITNFVPDQSGAAAPNAEVTITDSGAHVSYKTKTTDGGQFTMPYLEADAEVINDVPNMTQNPLFFAMPQNGGQPRNENANSMTIGSLGRSK
jgi:hypothetical protein